MSAALLARDSLMIFMKRKTIFHLTWSHATDYTWIWMAWLLLLWKGEDKIPLMGRHQILLIVLEPNFVALWNRFLYQSEADAQGSVSWFCPWVTTSLFIWCTKLCGGHICQAVIHASMKYLIKQNFSEQIYSWRWISVMRMNYNYENFV